jgi:uncharacterized membrane protein YeaQ/YmgE (transglycosylase-associated protein family)
MPEQEKCRQAGTGAVEDRVRPGQELVLRYVMPVGFGLAATALVLFNTSRYGVGLVPDSANYVSAARSLLAGRSLLCFDATPFVNWPPLFPAILASAGLGGIDMFVGARFLNAVVFGITVFLSIRLFGAALRSGLLVLVGSLLVVGSNALQSVSSMLLSDAVFCLLAVAFMATLARLLATRAKWLLVLCCILAALLCLQRYAGLVFVFAGALSFLVWQRGSSLRGRVVHAGVLLGAAGIPLAGWLVRNYVVTGTVTGARSPAVHTVFQKLVMTLVIIGDWFYPRVQPGWLAWVLFGLFGTALAGLIAVALTSARRSARSPATIVRVSAAVLVVFVLTLAVLSSIVAFDEISPRLLAPVYVPTVVLVLCGLEAGGRWWGQRLGRCSVGRAAVLAIAGLSLVHLLPRSVQISWMWHTRGVGMYTQPEWQESPLLAWLRKHRLEGPVVSNDPAAVYLLLGREARMSPRRTQDPVSMLRTGELKHGEYLVWFIGAGRPYLYQVDELYRMLPMELVHAAEDGGVLVLR